MRGSGSVPGFAPQRIPSRDFLAAHAAPCCEGDPRSTGHAAKATLATITVSKATLAALTHVAKATLAAGALMQSGQFLVVAFLWFGRGR